MNKKHILILAVICSIIIITLHLINDKKDVSSARPLKIFFELAKKSNVKKDFSFPATISVSEEISVISEVSGKIISINAKSGAEVKKGQIIIEINDQIYKISLNKHRASLKYNELQLQRLSKLTEKGVLSKKVYDEALSKYESSRSALATAEYDLNNTKVRSPSDGIISLQNINVGEYIEKGKKIFSLFNFDKLVANFYVSQTTVNEVKLGQKVKLSIPNFGNLIGYISFISPNFEQGSNSIKVEAKIDNPEKKYIASNSFAKAVVKSLVEDVILISEDAVIFEKDKIYLFILKDNKVNKRQIELGPKYKNYVVVTKGLESDEKVVVRGQINLNDGQQVESEEFIRKIEEE